MMVPTAAAPVPAQVAGVEGGGCPIYLREGGRTLTMPTATREELQDALRHALMYSAAAVEHLERALDVLRSQETPTNNDKLEERNP
jgi:hypothetical protein